jgi:hypothetical protein
MSFQRHDYHGGARTSECESEGRSIGMSTNIPGYYTIVLVVVYCVLWSIL